jgi:DNA-binding NarL/FixJ family response regulator
MEALWLLGNPTRLFRAPCERMIINKQGELIDNAALCEVSAETSDEFVALCEQVDVLVLVAADGLLDNLWFSFIPANLARVGLMLENSHPEAQVQLTMAGIDGYVSSSMSEHNFTQILRKIIDDKHSISGLQEELKNYSTLAFTAMSSASEMGTVAVFAEKVQEVMELHRLANLLLTCLADLRVDGVVQFVFDDDISIFPVDAPFSSQRLLQNALQTDARIVSHGRFLLFCFDHVQLLVTDAPHVDPDRYGRLRDVLAHVVSIAESRAKTLKVNTLLKVQQDNTRMVMTLLEMASVDNRNSVKEIMMELSLSLRSMAMGLDLNMEQEAQLLGLSEKALNSLEGLQEATSAVEEHFRSLLQQLDTASNLLQSADTDQSNTAEASDNRGQDENHCDSRVELF